MMIVLAVMAGAFIGVLTMGLLLCAKGDDVCIDCPYKRFYLESITGEFDNGSRH